MLSSLGGHAEHVLQLACWANPDQCLHSGSCSKKVLYAETLLLTFVLACILFRGGCCYSALWGHQMNCLIQWEERVGGKPVLALPAASSSEAL